MWQDRLLHCVVFTKTSEEFAPHYLAEIRHDMRQTTDMPFLHQSSDGFGNGFLTRDVRRSGQGVHSNTTDVLVVPIGQPKQAVIDRLLSGGLQTREEIAHIIRDFIIVRFETL